MLYDGCFMTRGSFSRRQFVLKAANGAIGLAAAQLLPRTVWAAPEPNSVAGAAAAHGILAGCAVNGPGLATDADFRRLVAAQAAIVVAEREMKWRDLRPTPETFDYTAADRLMSFAQQNGMLVRGHNLCWHEALPVWFEATVTRDNAAQFLTDHIHNVTTHFAGRIHSWDVVNEAINVGDGRRDGLRNSPWLRFLGPGYIDMAFRAARAGDAHALLTYNDYGIEADDAKAARKRDAVLHLIKTMKKRGTPIDAVGIQSHLRVPETYGSGLRRFIRDAHKLGLQAFVTELDVDDSHVPGSFAERDRAVAEVYSSYLDLVLSEGVRVIVTWGITDRYSWLTNQHPRPDGKPARGLPFDDNLQPVDAFNAMLGSFRRLPESPSRA